MEGAESIGLALEEAMRRLIRLIEEYSALQTELRLCLERRDWTDLERVRQALERKAGEAASVEEERASLWARLSEAVGRHPQDSFYTVVFQLSPALRERLAELRQALRLAVLHVEGTQKALSTYVRLATEVIQAYLRDICPDLKAGTYGPAGQLKTTSRFSLMLDTQI